MIATPTTLGGIDDQEYQRSLDVDFHREEKKSLTFGTDHHRCPGTHLARTEVRITLEEWMRRIPDFSVAPDAEVTFTGGVVGVVDTVPLVWGARGI